MGAGFIAVSPVKSTLREAGNVRRFLLAALVAMLIALLVVSAWNALPGDPLHPVRALLQDVGLADYTLEDVDALEQKARSHIERAEEFADEDRDVTLQQAGLGLQLVIDARAILRGVPPPDKAIRSARIDGLERRATTAIGEVEDVLRSRSSE